MILSGTGRDGEVGADGKVSAYAAIRSRRLRDRLSPGDVKTLIDLYRSGATAKQVAEKFGVSLRSVKRLLHQHGVRRKRCTSQPVIEVVGTRCSVRR
ncbi:MAG: helix-turn-helix domain-containing protein [Pseudonocardiaceae bacterium]